MIKKLFAAILALLAAAAFAAVDVNKATQADLESIKGIGPVISGKILDERKKAPFKDWNDMATRVKGVGEVNAAKFSAEGLTVNGGAFAGAPAASAKHEGKSTMKSEAKSPAADAGKATGAPAKAPESTTLAPAPGKKGTSSAAATDETRQRRAEERKAEAAVKAKERAAKRAAEANPPAAGSAPSKKK